MSTARIGLVGGLALNAGLFYYEELAKRFSHRNKALDLVLVHANLDTVLGFVAKGDVDSMASYFTHLFQ